MTQATRLGRVLFVLALGVYGFSAGGSLTTTDAVVTFDVTRSIVDHGSVAMSGNLLGMEAHRGRDGRYYSPFGIGQSLYNIPFYVSAKALVALTGLRIGKSDTLEKAFVALGQTVVGAAIVWQVFRVGVALTGDVISSALAALTLAFGSILWPYARFGFNQPLACLTLLCAARDAFLGVRRHEARRLVFAGGWVAASLLTRHEMAVAAVPIACWVFLDGRARPSERLRRVAAFAPGVLAGVAAWMIFNAVRFGNPLDSGYLRDPIPGFGSPVGAGLAALLFSPSASLFLYSPVAVVGLVGLWRLFITRDRSGAILFASLIATFLVLYASMGNWLGGRSYGSRYLVVVLPYCGLGWAALLAMRSNSWRRRAFATVMAVGLAVQIPGVLLDYAKISQSVAVSEGRFATEERQWQWNASPLALNTRALVRAVPDNIGYVLGRRPIPRIEEPETDSDRGFSQQFSFSLDLWWLYLYYLGLLPRLALAGIVMSFVVFVVLCDRRLAKLIALARPA